MGAVLITGGSRGIGRATALAFAQNGWDVALTYRADSAAANETADAVTNLGQAALPLQGDVSDEAAVQRWFHDARTQLGSLDAVVINAGIVGEALPLAQMSRDRLQTMFDTNLLGAALCAREAARTLPTAKSGPDASVVFVSSAAARLGSPFEYVDYAASKGALDTLTLGLSKELAPDGIRVNAVRPGLIETDIHASGGQPDRAQRLGQTVPLARPGQASEVANAILWLCTPQASYCTGTILDVAGGR